MTTPRPDAAWGGNQNGGVPIGAPPFFVGLLT
ncbi:hypothetical protein J2Y89_002894 [Curtobacterium herbarum]|nr:hypothetical protein [Curtobacterium herbarum]